MKHSVHRCCMRTAKRPTWENYTCGKNAKYFEKGRWWCGWHAPSKVAAKWERQQAKIEAEFEEARERHREQTQKET